MLSSQDVSARSADEPVFRRTSPKLVGALAADDAVLADAPHDPVPAGSTLDLVVAAVPTP